MSFPSFNFPAAWAQVKLGAICANRGETVTPAKSPDLQFELYSVPAFPTRRPEMVLGSAVGSSKQKVEAGSVLLCRINPRINRVWVVEKRSRHPQIASTEWMIFPEHPDILARFLRYFLQQYSVRDFLAHNASGVGGSLMRVKPSTLRDFPFAHPPLPEQHRMVAKIEELFSELDKGIENLKQAKAQLAVYRQALLKHAFEGKLTADWRAAHADQFESPQRLLARIRSERRRKLSGDGRYSEPPDPEPEGLPQIPKEWGWARMDLLGMVGSGMSVSKDRALEDPIEVPYMRVANVQRGRLHLSEIKTMKVEKTALDGLRLRAGDVLFNEGGDLDKLGRGWVWDGQIDPCITQNHVFRVTPVSSDVISSKFLSYWGNMFGQEFFLTHGKQTTNLASINKAALSGLPVPVPTIAEQLAVVAHIEEATSATDALQSDIETNLAKSEALRQSVLKKAFAGELVPQDPDDEPASGSTERAAKSNGQ